MKHYKPPLLQSTVAADIQLTFANRKGADRVHENRRLFVVVE